MERHCFFGDIVRLWGLASAEQVLTALNVQHAQTENGLRRRFIGDVMVDLGLISSPQRNEVLEAQSLGASADALVATYRS
jgi:hypothetical protein